MQNQQRLLDELAKLLAHKKSKAFYAKRLGVTEGRVESLLEQLKLRKNVLNYSTFLPSKKVDVQEGEIEINTYYTHEPTPEDIIRDHKIDINKYKLASYWSKAKHKGWQVSALFTKINRQEASPTILAEVLKNYKSTYKPFSSKDLIINNKFTNKTMVELSFADYHLEKASLEEETIEQRIKTFNEKLDNLILRCYAAFNIEEIVFVIGNDFFNSDTWHSGTTEHGHFQDNNCIWDKTYELGFDTLVNAIMKLKQFCNKLKVLVIPGNHAKTKEFYLGHALEIYFRNDSNIEFDRTSAPRKVHAYGSTLIGYHHGNCKIDQLPLIMATEFFEEWGKCKFKEIHTGDKHFYMEKEIHGVRIKQIPSMSPTDRWHNEHNYVGNIRAALAIVYDKERGRIAEFEDRI